MSISKDYERNAAIERYMESYQISETAGRGKGKRKPEQTSHLDGDKPKPDNKSLLKKDKEDKSSEHLSEAKPDEAAAITKSSHKEEKASEKPNTSYAARDKERVDNTKKHTSKRDIVMIAVACCFFIAAALTFIGQRANISPRVNKDDIVYADFQLYRGYADAAVAATSEFALNAWESSADALNDFTNLLNPGLPDSMLIHHSDGTSFATAKADPWGTPYYITAMRLGGSQGTSKYSFYITSAGKNKQFDTSKLVLDKDDVFELLYPMEKYQQLQGEHKIFAPSQLDESTSSILDAKEAVPITFDFQGGENGTPFVEAIPGTLLPNVKVPTREGYQFAGYYAGTSSKGIRYYDSVGIGLLQSPFTEGTTLYAIWEELDDTDSDKENVETEAPTENTEENTSTKPQPQKTTYTIQEYVMNTDGSYPSSPTRTTQRTAMLGDVIQLKSVSSQEYIPSGTMIDYFELNRERVNDTVELREANSVLSIYYTRTSVSLNIEVDEGIADVIGANPSYFIGEVVNITAVPKEGYVVQGWSGDYSGLSETLAFTMPNKAVSVKVSTMPTEVSEPQSDVSE